MKLWNRFTIGIVFTDENTADTIKQKLEEKVSDLEITKKLLEEDGNKYVELTLKCDSGSSSIVNGTRFRWDDENDPNDEETITDLINWLKDFPL